MSNTPSLEEQLQFIENTEETTFSDFYEFFFSLDKDLVEAVEKVVESQFTKQDNKTTVYQSENGEDQTAIRKLRVEGYVEYDLKKDGQGVFELTDKGREKLSV